MMQTEVVLDSHGYAMRYEYIGEMLNHFRVGDEKRIAIELIAITGMRCGELNNISPECFWWNKKTKKLHLLWKTIKTSPKLRNEELPDWFTHELDLFFQRSFRGFGYHGKLLSFSSESFRRLFNGRIRSKLGGIFLSKRPAHRSGRVIDEYICQMKGLRHTFASTLFWKYAKEYGQDMALHLTSVRMKHSSTYMTARHYASNILYLKDELDKWPDKEPGEIIGELLGYPGDFKLEIQQQKYRDIRPFSFGIQDIINSSA